MPARADFPSTSTPARIFFGLGALTLVNVFLSYLPLNAQAGIAVKTLIATGQCGVIAYFLLNLRGENRIVSYGILAALFLIVSLIAALIPDIGIVHLYAAVGR